MKKILPIIIITILVLSGLGAIAYSNDNIKIEKIRISISNISFKNSKDTIKIETDSLNSVLYKENYYQIPTHNEIFKFPFGTEILNVVCTPNDLNSIIIEKKLKITDEPQSSGLDIIDNQETKSKEPCTIQSWFDYDIGTGIENNNRYVFVKVRAYPIQYHPSDDLIEWAESMDISIEYNIPKNNVQVDESEYVSIILTPSDFYDDLNRLVQHKNSIGLSTILVSLDEIYNSDYFSVQGRDNPEKIKYFIKNAIENWGTYYVTLVGSADNFPIRQAALNFDRDNYVVSDFYYADIYKESGEFSSWDTNDDDVFAEFNADDVAPIDELDLYPDVYIGRLACNNLDEVNTCIDKIISYETTRAYTQNWFTNLLLIGGDSHVGETDIPEGEYHNEAVLEVMDGFIPIKIWATNDMLSGFNPTGVDAITDAIEDGCGFIDFSGHGNTNVWSTHPHNNDNVWIPTPIGGWLNTHIGRLNNIDKLPIIISDACCISKFHVRPDCWSWSYLSNPDGGGIACMGSSSYSYFYTDNGSTEGLCGALTLRVFESFGKEGIITLGEMWGDGINNYEFYQAEDLIVDYKTIEQWILFGDPSLRISEESHPPEKPSTPEGPTSGKINTELTYKTTTTDIDGDEIYYLFDWGNGEYSEWIGPYTSDEIAEASYSWNENGEYEIKVMARDENGKQSEWSDPIEITLAKTRSIDFLTIKYVFKYIVHIYDFIDHLF